jgi:hypothetical protein
MVTAFIQSSSYSNIRARKSEKKSCLTCWETEVYANKPRTGIRKQTEFQKLFDTKFSVM